MMKSQTYNLGRFASWDRGQVFRSLWSSSNENNERSAILLSFVLTCYISRSIRFFVQSINHSEKHNLRVTRFYLNLNYTMLQNKSLKKLEGLAVAKLVAAKQTRAARKNNQQKLQVRKEPREENTHISGMLSFTSENVLDEEIPESVPIPPSLYVERGVNDFTVIFGTHRPRDEIDGMNPVK